MSTCGIAYICDENSTNVNVGMSDQVSTPAETWTCREVDLQRRGPAERGVRISLGESGNNVTKLDNFEVDSTDSSNIIIFILKYLIFKSLV